MNAPHDTLHLTLHLQPPSPTGLRVLALAASVNGRPLAPDPDYVISLGELGRSRDADGVFDIITCECGSAGCVGIGEGITVRHQGEDVRWTMREPAPAAYRFYRYAYVGAVSQVLKAFKQLLQENRAALEDGTLTVVPWDYEYGDMLVGTESADFW